MTYTLILMLWTSGVEHPQKNLVAKVENISTLEQCKKAGEEFKNQNAYIDAYQEQGSYGDYICVPTKEK